jgi:hypothetical protein
MQNLIETVVAARLQLKVLAPVDELQCDPESRSKWIFYSALDAKTTHELYNALRARLHDPLCVFACWVKPTWNNVGSWALLKLTCSTACSVRTSCTAGRPGWEPN